MRTDEINRTLDTVNRLANEAFAYNLIESRADEAHAYCQQYLIPSALGKNIWHAILDDAIRMRKENNK